MKYSVLAYNNDGFVVLPKLPMKAHKERRAAWAAVKAAGLKGLHPYPAKMKAQAQAFADACTAASGVKFDLTECIY